MTVTKPIRKYCAGDGCDAGELAPTGEAPPGWGMHGGRWFCPLHADLAEVQAVPRALTCDDVGCDCASKPAVDLINHPPHYKAESGIEAIDVIEGFGLGFHLGNAVKYILRAGRKGDALEDLRKARWYLDREIARRSS